MRLYLLLGVLALLHMLGLLSFYTFPFAFDTPRNLYAEVLDVEFWVFPAIFVAIWVLISLLIILRHRKLHQPGELRSLRLLSVGICAILLVFAIGAIELVPESLPLFQSYGADLPTPTLILIATYQWWLLLPALGLAVVVMLFATTNHQGGIAMFASGSLIGLLFVANASIFGTLLFLFLPFFAMCGPMEMNAGFTRLHAAATLGREASVRRQITEGALPDISDESGATPLHLAVSESHLSVVRVLLERGASVKTTTRNGTTPLHFAARSGQTDIAEWLLARGADVNAQDNKGMTPLDQAHQRNQMAPFLIERGGVRSTKESRQVKLGQTEPQASREAAFGSCRV